VTENFAVELQGVGKRFMRHADRRNTLKERLVRGRARNTQDFWAVKDASVQIPKGSVYGLIGHNGSGKSTLLKLITGIYRPTEGKVTTDGRVAALIELGAGFHPDMTGRENIRLNGSILGLGKSEIENAMETIIDFSGLREFIDDPVKHYSSGMYVRLGFSVAVHMKPDVLLVDEVLAVGDEEFQRKCFDHLYTLRRQGRTIVVVSHGLGQLEGLCDEVAWLDHGTVQEIGPATEVIGSYLQRVNAEEAKANAQIAAERDDTTMRAGSGIIRSRSARLIDSAGHPLNHAETGLTFGVEVRLDCYEQVLGPNMRFAFQHETGPLVTMMSNHRRGFDFGYIDGEKTVKALLTDNPLLPGRYRVHIDVFDHTGSVLIDNWDDALEFTVRSPRGEIGQGFIELPYTYEID
jgi:ABC-2 type transport system ATP-binding protein/lipopolysaccharide transport system ATP-binding protein